MGANVRTLMCRDDPVLRFRYDPSRIDTVSKVSRKAEVIDGALLPVGAVDTDGRYLRPLFARWLSDRAVPMTRDGVAEKLFAMGETDTSSLMVTTLGLSLSDQYWFLPDGLDVSWGDVNPYENDFDDRLGTYLVGHDPDSEPPAPEFLVRCTSPDAAASGNLPKRWSVDPDGTRVMLKAGREANLCLEPVCESLATSLCRRILSPGDFVPYEVRKDPDMGTVSACPCFCSVDEQFVSAAHVYHRFDAPSSASMRDRYVRNAARLGADVAGQVERTAVVDHILANRDRHWGNFGVMLSRDGSARPAPVFDCGESLYNDGRGIFGGRLPKAESPMPFHREQRDNFDRTIDDLSWLDPGHLKGFPDEVADILRDALPDDERGRVPYVRDHVRDRCRDVERKALELSRRGRGLSL